LRQRSLLEAPFLSPLSRDLIIRFFVAVVGYSLLCLTLPYSNRGTTSQLKKQTTDKLNEPSKITKNFLSIYFP
jgi:hypothetical protein